MSVGKENMVAVGDLEVGDIVSFGFEPFGSGQVVEIGTESNYTRDKFAIIARPYCCPPQPWDKNRMNVRIAIESVKIYSEIQLLAKGNR